jgi:hypothetical protein
MVQVVFNIDHTTAMWIYPAPFCSASSRVLDTTGKVANRV